MPEGLDHQRAYYDWCMFNQRHFAAWHQWMHDLVRKHAPNVPTHIKIVPFFLSSWGDGDIATGMDPELFTEITEFAGNDCLSEPQAGDRYGYNWDLANRWYDLLHSFGNKPVFNSENHMSAGPCQHLDPRQTYTANWQEAIHHRGATTIWVWEEPLLPSLEGRMYMRPANIYAAGTAMLDVNRLARELATVARAKPKVAMLYSMNCLFWNKDYLRSKTIQTLYAALTFMGQPVTFVSERQLKQGRYTDVDWILLPEATHVTDDTVEALRQFMKRGGRIVATGCDNLRWDEYHRERTLADEFKAVKTIDLGDDDRATSRILHGLFVQDGLAVVDLIDRDTGEPAWGIEYRLVTDAKGFLVSLTNHTRRTQNVSLNLKGKAKDLVSGRSVHPDRLKLEPMTPVLLKIDP